MVDRTTPSRPSRIITSSHYCDQAGDGTNNDVVVVAVASICAYWTRCGNHSAFRLRSHVPPAATLSIRCHEHHHHHHHHHQQQHNVRSSKMRRLSSQAQAHDDVVIVLDDESDDDDDDDDGDDDDVKIMSRTSAITPDVLATVHGGSATVDRDDDNVTSGGGVQHDDHNDDDNDANDEIYASPESLSAALFESRRVLYRYQYEDVVRMARDRRHPHVIRLDMGLGKTTEGWALIQHERYVRCRHGRPWAPALVIAPKSVLYNWQGEARDYVFRPDDVATAVHVHHGAHRHRTPPPPTCTVILTTYDVVRIDSARPGGFLPHIARFSIVIADEAHLLRNVRLVAQRRRNGGRATAADPAKTAAAVCALTARSDTRYALTGTPFVNRTNDLVALAKFLADDGNVSFLTHAPSVAVRDRRLSRWIEQCMVVRRKCVLDVPLPPKRTLVSWLKLSALETTAYEMCVDDIEALLREYAGNMRACSGALLALITRLRQLCLSIAVVTEPAQIRHWYGDGTDGSGGGGGGGGGAVAQPGAQEAHLVEQVRASTKLRCVLLDTYRCAYASPEQVVRAMQGETNDAAGDDDDDDDTGHCNYETICAEHANERVVVASESKIFLQLVHVALRSECVRAELGVQHLPVPHLLMFTGDVNSLAERDALLNRFNGSGGSSGADDPGDDAAAVVLLMTRPCGGVGLNLNRARFILVADAWWHPAAIAQLTDRVHRIGQTRDVYVLRYPVEGSIEEFLLSHEVRKNFVANRYLGTADTRTLALLRRDAMQQRGADGILKDIVGFLHDKTGRSTWRASFDDIVQRLLLLVGAQRRARGGNGGDNGAAERGRRLRLQIAFESY